VVGACNTFVFVAVPAQFDDDAHVSTTTPLTGTIDPPLPVTDDVPPLYEYMTLP
jgi:hypothetical protein